MGVRTAATNWLVGCAAATNWLVGCAEGQAHRHLHPALARVSQLETVRGAVEVLQAGARVGEPDPGGSRVHRRSLRPIVPDAQLQPSAHASGADAQASALRTA